MRPGMIQLILSTKYPGAVIWYRREEQIGAEFAIFGAKISRLERVNESVGPYLVPCIIVDVDE